MDSSLRFGSLTLGIVSGAGPMAGALLYQKIIEKCQKVYSCSADEDFPKIWICNYPFSPMIRSDESLQNKNKLVLELESVLSDFQKISVNRIGIACNTLHCFLPSLNQLIPGLIEIPIIIKKRLKKSEDKKMLILGTETTVSSGLFFKISKEIVYPSPLEQEIISTIIDRVLSGKLNQQDALDLKVIFLFYKTKVDSILIGCTELSVILEKFKIEFSNLGLEIIDPLDLLTEELLSVK